MTRVILTNSNTGVATPRYIEMFTTTIEEHYENDLMSFTLPVPPDDWLTTAPKRILFDLKQVTESFQCNCKIDVDSNRNAGPNYTVDADTYVEVTKDKLKEIAKTGGEIRLIIIRGNGAVEYTGGITNLKFTELPEDQPIVGSPHEFGAQFTFMLGENYE